MNSTVEGLINTNEPLAGKRSPANISNLATGYFGQQGSSVSRILDRVSPQVRASRGKSSAQFRNHGSSVLNVASQAIGGLSFLDQTGKK